MTDNLNAMRPMSHRAVSHLPMVLVFTLARLFLSVSMIVGHEARVASNSENDQHGRGARDSERSRFASEAPFVPWRILEDGKIRLVERRNPSKQRSRLHSRTSVRSHQLAAVISYMYLLSSPHFWI